MSLETIFKKTNRAIGVAVIGATHTSCLGIGALEGRLNAMGIKADIPLVPFWGVNIVGTAAGTYILSKSSNSLPFTDQLSGQEIVIKGAFIGAVNAPILYSLGYILGYLGTWAAENLF